MKPVNLYKTKYGAARGGHETLLVKFRVYDDLFDVSGYLRLTGDIFWTGEQLTSIGQHAIDKNGNRFEIEYGVYGGRSQIDYENPYNISRI